MTKSGYKRGRQRSGSVTLVQLLEYERECNEYEYDNTNASHNHLVPQQSSVQSLFGSNVRTAVEDAVLRIEAGNRSKQMKH